ncbi:hypothetical protein WH96_01160 [Kiloniella spongiae]|uniref:Uncharacterized protein n=1 Tax=Kiloniella spongiae TaxID=1489064 RepID=A0A0H2MIE9_9PROT|nr:hypothetical protein [Kiloniella spongiae]KLN62173.1 hypothetical protein WH96_01160 [Kiloniella spongiae]
MGFFKRLFQSPTSYIWFSLHTLIFVAGVAFLHIPQLKAFLGEALASGIGTSFIATGATGVVLFLYIFLNDDLKNKFETLRLSGLSHAFNGRSTRIREEYDNRIKESHKIDVIGFGLSQFRQDHLKNFAEWSKTKKIRILLLDPKMPSCDEAYAKQRDIEESNPTDTIIPDINKFVSDFQGLKGVDKKNFQVRYMRALPSVNIFKMDDEVFWGPYLIGEQSRNTMTFVAQKGGFVYKQLADHFETIWTSKDFSREI